MVKEAWQSIVEAKHIVIVSHVHPDGDAIGSCLGLFNVLKSMKKRASLYNKTKEELPIIFDFLQGYKKINKVLPKNYDLIVSCDCGSYDRLGLDETNIKLINIDHHHSNTLFGDINLVNPKASSAGMVVYEMLKANKVDIPKDAAVALYTAIADDTGFFRYGDLGAKTFEAAKDLATLGANPSKIASFVHSRKSLAKIRILAYMYQNFMLHCDGEIASIVFTKELMLQTGATRMDTKNIVSNLRDLVSVKVAIMVLEQEGFCKVSLRSDGSKDVSEISALYKGGGHKGAAGFSVDSEDGYSICNILVEKVRDL